MAEDASLDDFLDAGEDQQADPGEPADAEERREGENVDAGSTTVGVDEDGGDATDDTDEGADDPAVDPAAVEGATATFTWSPEGGACDGCGEVVERRWRDEPGLVCAECKDW